MPALALSLLCDERATAFDGFCRLIETNPRLRAVGLTVRKWTGDPRDADEPSSSSLPWLRLTPSGIWQPNDWVVTGTILSPIVVRFELVVGGSDVRDSMRLWRAIEHAIFGRVDDAASITAAREALDAAGISSVDSIVPAFGFDPSQAMGEDGSVRQSSVGSMTLRVYIECPGY